MQKSIFSILPSEVENVFVAYSGGIDSHVLLHLISSIAQLKPKITAVYVNHGLQKESVQWASHCEATALALRVKFQCINVNAEKTIGKSPEEAARDARYSALKTLLNKDDVLFLAQHREDQMETVLLQLFRGAGVRGLSGMPLSSVFGKGEMLRPFLDVSKKDIIDYAKNNNLQWVEDPSNKCDDFNRNFLRNEIVPKLKKRWPALDKTIARSARHCANSNQIAQSLGKELLGNVINEIDWTLNIALLVELDDEKQTLVIRQWFDSMGLRMPSEKRLDKIINEVIMAKDSANPKMQEQGCFVRRYRGKLYCLRQDQNDQAVSDIFWPTGLKRLDVEQGESLMVTESSEGISKALWNNSKVSIKFRKGSEKIKLPKRAGYHSLKNLYQEKAIPPWERNAIPLVYINDQLAAIADLWISADFYDWGKEDCYRLEWSKNNL